MDNRDYEKALDKCWNKFCESKPTLSKQAGVLTLFNFIFDYIHHNLTSDAEGEEMLTCERKWIQQMYADGVGTHYLLNIFGSKCLPDENSSKVERLEKNDESKPAEPKFKFKIGDKLLWDKKLVEVYDIDETNGYYLINAPNGRYGVKESDLEPYTELEKESRNLSQETANCDKAVDNDLKDTHQNESLFGKKLDCTMTGRLLGVENLRLKIAAMAMQGILANPHQQNVDMPIDQIAELAISIADVLIAECRKGGEK